MKTFITGLQDIISNDNVRKKIFFTLMILAIYRMLVWIPVPFADIDMVLTQTGLTGEGIQYFAMLLGGTLDQFSIIAVGLAPYINASIIMQLLTNVIPHLEELQEQGEAGTTKIQQYTRWISFPLAFLQGIGMVYFINFLLGGNVIEVSNFTIVLLTAFVLSVCSVLLMRLGELITEKGISNGTSLLIFASIVAGITSQVYTSIAAASGNVLGVIAFMLVMVLVLIILSLMLLKTRKEIPVVYAKRGKIEQTSSLPIPLNPVGMVPIIFAIAFTSFPYILSQLLLKFGTNNNTISAVATWIESNLNIYTQQPSLIAIVLFFLLIVMFTFFYTFIAFNPEKIADNIQKKGGFIPGMRPGVETAKYISGILMHLCLLGGVGLGFLGIYSYIINYLPIIQDINQALGSIPVVVTGSGVIIIVGVVQDLLNKVNAELLMKKYERI